MSFLELRGIDKRFGATVALNGVDLSVESGEVHALVGENGSGKSTLMRILAGALTADAGSMTLSGAPFEPRNPMDARLAGVAMIHQELSLCSHLSVAENVLLGMEPTALGKLKTGEMRQRAQEALAKLGASDLDVDTRAGTLPIGMRQLVEIARAVAVGSQVVVLDEPTSSLTESDAERLFQVVAALRASGHAIVYISHFLDEIKRCCDRLTVLRDGNVIGTRTVSDVNVDDIVEMMVGRQIESLYPRSQRSAGETILDLVDVAGASKPADANLTLRRGEVVGIAGLNGAGRTELLRAVFGLDRVKSGDIRFAAYAGPYSPAARWSQGLGMLSEDRKSEGLALGMSIADNLTLTGLDRLGSGGVLSLAKQRRAADEWIEKLGVKCRDAEQRVGDLSGGNQQKVALARLLFHGVDLLMLDEPTRGIDVASKEQIYRLIDRLACENKAVLVVSSYLPELLGICDRVAVMHKGILNIAKPIAEIDAETIMHEAIGA